MKQCATQGMSEDPASLSRVGECDGVEMLQLLRSCAGAFRPGILTALVGSSGAGKTTLMDCLAGRKTSASVRPGSSALTIYPDLPSTYIYVDTIDLHIKCCMIRPHDQHCSQLFAHQQTRHGIARLKPVAAQTVQARRSRHHHGRSASVGPRQGPGDFCPCHGLR